MAMLMAVSCLSPVITHTCRPCMHGIETVTGLWVERDKRVLFTCIQPAPSTAAVRLKMTELSGVSSLGDQGWNGPLWMVLCCSATGQCFFLSAAAFKQSR